MVLDNSSKNSCIKYNNDIMTKIINSGVGLDDTDIYDNTPLHYATKTNNYLALKTLLSFTKRNHGGNSCFASSIIKIRRT